MNQQNMHEEQLANLESKLETKREELSQFRRELITSALQGELESEEEKERLIARKRQSFMELMDMQKEISHMRDEER